MKIYEIGTGYTPIPARMGAATEIVVEELTRAFLKQGQQVQIMDIAADDRLQTDLPIREIFIPKCFRGTDVKLGVIHKLKRVAYSIALADELRKLLKETVEPVILHFHNQYNLFFFLKLVSSRLRKKAVISYTVHSYIWPDKWENIRGIIKKRYFQEVFCVQNADCVLVLNEKTAEHFTERLGVSQAVIHKIGNGVNTDVYRILPKTQRDMLRENMGLKDKKVLLQVGSVCERKNQLGAVQALKEYLRSRRDVMYVYAGGIIDAEYQRKIVKFAEDNGISDQVCYLGELCPGEILNQYYNIADATLFPSQIESFGLVIIESLASGTRVLLSDTPQFKLQSGYSIFRSEGELVSLLDQLLLDRITEIQARNEVEKFYSWKKIAEDHLRIWNR